MVTCPNCKKELSDDARFCNSCGTRISKTIYCPGCGKQTSLDYAFCPNCGASITEAIAEKQAAAADAPVKKEKNSRLAIILGIICAAAIAAVILVIALFSGGGNTADKAENSYALYLKDREIFYSDLKKDSDAWQLTSRLVDSDEVTDLDLSLAAYSLGGCSYMSEDGRYIFFPDKTDGNGFSLYFKEVANPDADAVKVDSDVVSYTVNNSATLVTYIKGKEGNLYQYKIGEDSKDKIASDVKMFAASDDGSKIGYINNENSVYVKYAGNEKEKIASDISAYEYVSDDLTTLYYFKDGDLYKLVEGADKVKIDSDVREVINIYDSGEIYYVTNKTEKNTLLDYVIDDTKEADAAVIKPEYPDYPDAPDRPSKRATPRRDG